MLLLRSVRETQHVAASATQRAMSVARALARCGMPRRARRSTRACCGECDAASARVARERDAGRAGVVACGD
eukprot:5796279-Lingulodinium_polyedra.AAC.1